ncbi:hypothetical protein PV11_05662 [Exophiala sideris]|uniref:Uncharacterized protein n=1 Tax=Exophiala sideris TaxID=1016849 RepID=A0A0D1ZA52_9EURO|nr:hypothetical protein PV11_05662 [Exophiala sideris]
MPETGRRESRVATVEDWDDDAQTALPGSRTTANVATKRPQQDLTLRSREQKPSGDADDPGYASRSATLVSEPTGRNRRKMPDLKLNTAIPERERQPYHVPQSASAKPSTRRQSSPQDKDLDSEPRLTKTRPVVHNRGTCQVCDHYGEHIDMKQERTRTSNVAAPPLSPNSVRRSASRGVRDDAALSSRPRRPSLDRQPRPISMVSAHQIPAQYITQAVYGPPVVSSPVWATPSTPTMSFNPQTYAHTPASPFSSTSFTHYQQFPQYYDAPRPMDPPPNRPSRRPSPVRRSSTNGEPVIRQSYPDGSTPMLERGSPRESRPILASRASVRTVDSDRIAMPPPPPPPTKQQQPEIVPVRRPSTRRAKTYHPSEPPVRERQYDSDYYDEDYFDVPKSRGAPSGTKDRREPPSLPPSSYRGPAYVDTRDRPGLARNYTTPTATTKVASSKVQEAPRRSTMATVPLEQKADDVEEYIRRRSKTSSELTAEALRNLNKGNSSSKSETGSSYSHKSLQSSSKDSSGRGRSHTSGTRTSITLPGGLNMSIPKDYMKEGRPLSINVNGLVLSVSAEGQERGSEQKTIERAPSINSRESRKSFSSGISSRGKERDATRASRRLSGASYPEDRIPSVRSSRQPSRAPSVSRPSYEYTTRRQSVDYKGYDDIAGA